MNMSPSKPKIPLSIIIPKAVGFPDGFAGTMGELLTAIQEDRAPYHSARHNLLTLQMTLAACRSAELDGDPVEPTKT